MQKVDKPWGHELIWAHTDKYVGKILFIKARQSLSLQYHVQKEETIMMKSGRMNLMVGTLPNNELECVEMNEGDVYHIKPGLVHRMVAVDDCYVIEVSTPELEDVVRLKDAYGRAPTI